MKRKHQLIVAVTFAEPVTDRDAREFFDHCIDSGMYHSDSSRYTIERCGKSRSASRSPIVRQHLIPPGNYKTALISYRIIKEKT